MTKARAKRPKSRRHPERQPLPPQQPFHQPRLLQWSAALFTLSLLIFSYQCLIPFLAHSKLSRLHRHTFPIHNNKPTAWFTRTSRTELPIIDSGATQDVLSSALNATDILTASSHETATSHPTAGRADNSSAQLLASLPDAPHPLPPLSVNASESRIPAGASWTGSLARGVLSALPLHWVAEMMHRPPETKKGDSGNGEGVQSIFTARRKGAWMGCERDFYLVCKGVYRAIKRTNAIRVVDVGCERNVGWLPHVVNKLRTEFRMVRLTCVVGKGEEEERVRKLYGTVEGMNVVVTDAYTAKFPNNTDMVVAYRLLEKGTLIDAMRFFKNVKKGNTVDVLATESYPESRNVPGENSGNGKLRINTALAPFWFPPSVYEYENAEEDPDGDHTRIVAVKVAEMFKTRTTPEMKDLVDPRKRHVVE